MADEGDVGDVAVEREQRPEFGERRHPLHAGAGDADYSESHIVVVKD